MAGVTGRSGGARKGAGRKPKSAADATAAPATQAEARTQVPVPLEDQDMLTMLQNVALGRVFATSLQVRAAIAAVQYTHVKQGDGGKKDGRAAAAKKAAGAGKYASAAPPKLAAAGGRRV